MKKRKITLVMMAGILLLVCCCCAAPVPVSCGAPGFLCRTGYIPGRGSMVFYEIEPIGIAALELVFGDNIPLYYYRWETWDE